MVVLRKHKRDAGVILRNLGNWLTLYKSSLCDLQDKETMETLYEKFQASNDELKLENQLIQQDLINARGENERLWLQMSDSSTNLDSKLEGLNKELTAER